MPAQEQKPTSIAMSVEDGKFLLRFAEPISGLVLTNAEATSLVARLLHGLSLAHPAAPVAQPSAEPVRIENDSDFCEAAAHCLLSSEMDLRHQGMALRDFALPALEYARFKLLCAVAGQMKPGGPFVTFPKALVDDRYHVATAPAGAGEPTEPSDELVQMIAERDNWKRWCQQSEERHVPGTVGEAVRMAYKTGYDEGHSDASDGMVDHDACEEGWQQYRSALGSVPAVEGREPSDTEKLAELMRGLDIGAPMANASPQQLFVIGRAIADQARAALSPAPAERGDAT